MPCPPGTIQPVNNTQKRSNASLSDGMGVQLCLYSISKRTTNPEKCTQVLEQYIPIQVMST